MAVTEVCYATREEVMRAVDIKFTARSDQQIDRAIQSASRSVDSLMHRVFYPTITTKYFDWPNFQATWPWKVYLDQAELADVTVNVPVVTSGGNVIPAADVFWGPWNYAPPYTRLELNRSTSATFGQGDTPQRDVAITGTFGYWVKTAPAGALAAAMTDTTGTVASVTNSAAVGVGDSIVVDSERMLVVDKSFVTTAQTQQSGLTTAVNNDVTLGVTDGTKYFINEVLLLDSEKVLVVAISGNSLTVIRGWDGSVLAAHTSATIYAPRSLTVTRGDLGTTAATHLNSAAVSLGVVPSLIKELAVGEAVNSVLQETGGYARTQGQGAGAQTNIGMSLDAIRKQALAEYGRKARTRTV
jgi:hypothetical protein